MIMPSASIPSIPSMRMSRVTDIGLELAKEVHRLRLSWPSRPLHARQEEVLMARILIADNASFIGLA